MLILFKPWRPMKAVKSEPAINAYLVETGKAVKSKFIDELAGSKSGRMYGGHRASAPGEYPAHWRGALLAGTNYTVSSRSVEIGSTAPHAKYLMGTSKMKKRRMFDNAMKEAKRPRIGLFAGFDRS